MLNALSLLNFSVTRSNVPLFAPLTLCIKPGDALEILGTNGIGKTSLLESIAGLHKEFEGETTHPSFFLYLSTKQPFEHHETVERNLIFWQKLWKTDETTFQEALALWNLNSLLHLPFETLSQGQKQRVNLARLSLKKAHLWLLDEPTANLDDKTIALFKKSLQNHIEQKGMVLIATHNPLGIGHTITLAHPNLPTWGKAA